MTRSQLSTLALSALMAVLTASGAWAGVTVYEKDDKYVEIGGRLQIQFHQSDPDGGDSADELFFRRLRPYIEGTVTENWIAKFQFDIGQAEDGNEVAVKDAYASYGGWENASLTLGNHKPPFSREFLTSSKRQQLVERTFVGDHNYGSPDRFIGATIKGHNESEKVQWNVGAGSASIDPDVAKLDFDSPANANSDFNQGWLAAARLDLYPMGEFSMEQGDFARETRWGFGVAGFTWSNDGDNDTFTEDGMALSDSKADVDSATGVEVSAALRSHGWSIDAQANQIDADAVVGSFTSGVFENGSTTLDVYVVEGGYMFGESFELVAGYESLDADNYGDAWNRTSFGFNHFLNRYKLKWQLTYRMGENIDGAPGVDADELFVQFQFVF